MIDQKDDILNIAEFWLGTRALGPGLRAAVWVQGCPFHCQGCISPEWIPDVPAMLIQPDVLAGKIMANPEIEGITISGGEPMMQAAGLASFIRSARSIRSIDVICFTGYQYERLQEYPKESGINKFLGEIDVLIDGPYVDALNDNQGLRGSSNQKIYYLTDRLKAHDFMNGPRQIEVHVNDGYAMMVGVPPVGLPNLLQSCLEPKQVIIKEGISRYLDRRQQ